MIWNNWSEFVAMGGYGLYVWGSVLVVLGSIVGELIEVAHRRRTLLQDIRSQT